MSNTIKIKRGTNLSNAGTPAAGELIYKSDTNQLFVGDGSTAATGLSPIGGSATGDIEGVTAGNGLTGGGTSGTVDLNIGAGTGIDVAADAISVDVSDFMANGANNRVLTATGTDAFRGEGNLTFDGSTLAVTGAITASSSMTVSGSLIADTLDVAGDITLDADGADVILKDGGTEYGRLTQLIGGLTLKSGSSAANAVIFSTDGDAIFAEDVSISAGKTFTFDSVGLTAVQTSSESFADNNTSLMTSAAINDRIESFGYITSDTTLSTEQVQDIVGAMFDSNTETRISATYQDGDGTIDLVVDDMTANDNTVTTNIAGTGIDVSSGTGNSTISVDVSDFMANGSDNRIVTATGADAMNAEANLTFDGSTLALDGVLTVTEGSGTNTVVNLNGSAATFLEKDTGTEFYIANNAQDKDIILRVNDGGSNVTAIRIDASDIGRVRLPNDNQRLAIGASDDIQITHDGTNSYIDNYTGHLTIKSNDTDKDIILSSDDGSGGETAYITLDGSATLIAMHKDTYFNDNLELYFGSHSDCRLYYEPTNDDFYIRNANGDTKIRNEATDADIIFSNDDGSGGNMNYMVIDGGATSIDLLQDTRLAATKKLFFDGGGNSYMHENTADSVYMVVGGVNTMRFYESSSSGYAYVEDNHYLGAGSSIDFTIRHDGSNTYLRNETGNLFFRNRTNTSTIFDDHNGVEHLKIDLNNSIVINEGGSNIDFRVEGDTDTHLLFSDAGTERIGIGTSSPGHKLDVNGSIRATDGNVFYGDSTSGVWSTGSWAGDFVSGQSYDRVCGIAHDGGEVVIIEKNAKNSILVDGDYFAYENGGFFSSNNSTYGNATGFKSNGAAMMQVCQKDGGSASLQSTGDLVVNSGFISGVGTADMQLRRTTNNDDRIVIEASETKIYGDTVERVRFGSYGIRNGYTGSAGTPSYSFKDDTDTGMYKHDANTLAFSVGGAVRATINSSGVLYVTSKVQAGNGGIEIWDGTHGFKQVLGKDSTYTFLKNNDGNVNIHLGDSGDGNNYYNSGGHRFRSMDGGTYFAAINSTGLRVGTGADFAQAKIDLLANTSTTSDGDGSANMAISGADSILLEGHNGGASGSNYGSIVWAGGSRRRAMITSVADGSTDTDIIGLSFYTQGTDGSGDFFESFRLRHNGEAHFDKDVIAFSSTPSDVRLKENFEKIENGLDIVSQLDGHTFNWKKGGERLSAGFKAQEVEKILPHLVDEKTLPLKSNDEKEYKTLRYEELIPYLVEAIKEQQVQIDELKFKLGE
jgi:hypothetical protein